ncbi:hypothetical protein PILCRDRAFT_7356 [Piloderma croceum F 1598]|uniref:Uncharacterized protein n=1 Tax=Piloderma croceum (strain F 1598) TaxID=765440 RepID=A0A0C3FGE2_PILCF|nr:hypothetical protein PILCRDRAFT_7356 [Piloderma croceum F 1598]
MDGADQSEGSVPYDIHDHTTFSSTAPELTQSYNMQVDQGYISSMISVRKGLLLIRTIRHCDSVRASLPALLHRRRKKTNKHPPSAGQNQSLPATTTFKAPKKTLTASRKSQKVESKRPRTRPPCPFGYGKTFNRRLDSQPPDIQLLLCVEGKIIPAYRMPDVP